MVSEQSLALTSETQMAKPTTQITYQLHPNFHQNVFYNANQNHNPKCYIIKCQFYRQQSHSAKQCPSFKYMPRNYLVKCQFCQTWPLGQKGSLWSQTSPTYMVSWVETISLLKWVRNSRSDTSLFIVQHMHFTIFVLVYVDDHIITGNESNMVQNVITQLASKFSIKDLCVLSYFLVVKVIPTSTRILLSQHKYIQDLPDKTRMLKCQWCLNACLQEMCPYYLTAPPWLMQLSMQLSVDLLLVPCNI